MIEEIKKVCSTSSIISTILLIMTMVALIGSYTYLENTYSKVNVGIEIIRNKIDHVITTKKETNDEVLYNSKELENKINDVYEELYTIKETITKLTMTVRDSKKTN